MIFKIISTIKIFLSIEIVGKHRIANFDSGGKNDNNGDKKVTSNFFPKFAVVPK